ncbi:MAG: hypothetical protein QOF21_558 [Actinomycetota bacterium]|jgi:plastocyanin
MINNASKFGLGVSVFGLLTVVASRLAGGDRIGAILFVGIAIVGAILAFGLGRAVGPDLRPFVGADSATTSTPIDPTEAPEGSVGPLLGAIGTAVALCGGALGPRWVIVGGLALAVGVAIWVFDTLRGRGVLAPRDATNLDNRLLGPLALPVGAFLLAITLAFSLSRVLLAVSETASWVLAFIVAAVLLAILWMIATRVPPTRAVVTAAGVGLLAVLVAGGAGASVGEREFHKHHDETPHVEVTAANLAFDRNVIGLPADTDVEIDFVNLDVGTFHNVAIYTSDEPGTPIFSGKPTARSQPEQYKFRTPDPGTYRYVCDFHPAMTGELRLTASDKEHTS